MMPCHICHIYGIWKNKEVGGCFKLSFGMAMQATKGAGGNFIGVGAFQLCNTPVLKLYCKSYYWIL